MPFPPGHPLPPKLHSYEAIAARVAAVRATITTLRRNGAPPEILNHWLDKRSQLLALLRSVHEAVHDCLSRDD